MSTSQDIHSVIKNINAVRFTNYISVSTLTALVYDTCLSFPREVRFIWRGRISLRKVLYVVCRYYGLICLAVIVVEAMSISNPSIEGCRTFSRWFASSAYQVEEASVNLLLILRLHALYGGQKSVFFFVLTLYLIELVLFFYAGARAGTIITFTPLPAGINFPGCFILVESEPHLTFTLLGWISALIFSSILLALSIYKVRDDVSHTAPRYWEVASWNIHHPMLLAIFRQGIIFYIINTFITLLSAIVVSRLHDSVVTIGVPLGVFSYSLCGCQFLLNFDELSNYDPHNISLEHTDGVVRFDNNTYMLDTL